MCDVLRAVFVTFREIFMIISCNMNIVKPFWNRRGSFKE